MIRRTASIAKTAMDVAMLLTVATILAKTLTSDNLSVTSKILFSSLEMGIGILLNKIGTQGIENELNAHYFWERDNGVVAAQPGVRDMGLFHF